MTLFHKPEKFWLIFLKKNQPFLFGMCFDGILIKGLANPG